MFNINFYEKGFFSLVVTQNLMNFSKNSKCLPFESFLFPKPVKGKFIGYFNFLSFKSAFTLAEVLITLGIIGVVAAMTLPVIIGNYQKQEAVSRLKKAYTSINQVLTLSERENGEWETWDDISTMNTYDYINKYWGKYFKNISICQTYSECGFSEMHPYKFLNGEQSTYTVAASNRRIGIVTSDGILYTINFASGSDGNLVQGDGIYIDINGPKGPNVYGKDFFSFLLVSGKGIVPSGYNVRYQTLNNRCSKTGNGNDCAAKIMLDGWQIKDDYPW